MNFNSLGYLLFLPLVILFYAVSPVRYRWAVRPRPGADRPAPTGADTTAIEADTPSGAGTPYEALYIYSLLPQGLVDILSNPGAILTALVKRRMEHWQITAIVLGAFIVVAAEGRMLQRLQSYASEIPQTWRSAVPEAALLTACVLLQPNRAFEFIYFQF